MPAETSPLSIESAIALIRETAPSADNSPAAQAQPASATGAAADQTDEEKQQAAADEQAAANGEQNTSGDQGDTNDEQADQGDALPPIEPPSSWKTEEKAVFETLPRAAQEAIQRREQDRTTELRNLQNRNADAQKAADAEVAKLKVLTDKIGAHIQNEVKALANDFPEIKSDADVVALAGRDPARFSLFQSRLMQFNAARQAEADAQTTLTQKAEVQQRESMEQAKTALIEAFPAWKDPQVARKEITELQDYAIKSGATEQAARMAFDPIVYKMAQKAMLYDRAQAAKAAAVKRDPPRVQRPGPSNSGSRADDKATRRQDQLSKLSRTGDIQDARGLLRA
jgi:hypothetical protein